MAVIAVLEHCSLTTYVAIYVSQNWVVNTACVLTIYREKILSVRCTHLVNIYTVWCIALID